MWPAVLPLGVSGTGAPSCSVSSPSPSSADPEGVPPGPTAAPGPLAPWKRLLVLKVYSILADN